MSADNTEVVSKKEKKINVPFGYFGSKNRIALQLCTALPPHNCWVEAFCGSAALTLRKSQAPIEIINDIDNEIVNLFKQLRNNQEELCRLVALTPYAEQELSNVRNTEQDLTDLEKARRFLVQSMMAINGVFGKARGGFSYSDSYSRNGRDARVNRWYNLPARIEPIVERLKSVRVENKDARKLLKRFIYRPASLLYLDPPYLGDRADGYNKDANIESFHEELLSIANKAESMIFISGYESEVYTTLLTERKGWQKKTIDASTKGSTGNSFDRTEVVWMNKHFCNAVKSNTVPIKLSLKEKRENKPNPERGKKSTS